MIILTGVKSNVVDQAVRTGHNVNKLNVCRGKLDLNLSNFSLIGVTLPIENWKQGTQPRIEICNVCSSSVASYLASYQL